MFFISSLIMMIFILLGVAFFTLFERKILGYIHFRLGPNKNLFKGYFQPFNDLFKLFSKMELNFNFINVALFFMCPFVMVFFSLLMWNIINHWGSELIMKYFFIYFMCINGMSIFFFLIPGWTSGSFYSSLGSYRSSAQMISYEGIFFFSILIILFFNLNFNLNMFLFYSYFFFIFFTLIYFFFCWLCSIVAESNRSPFDFAEGESELVSGFNTEYGAGLFSLIFLSEYMSIFFLTFFTSFLILANNAILIIFNIMMLFFFVWIRVSFPRLRYDKLMIMSWKSIMFYLMGLVLLYIFFLIF